ncbi:MAG TPA: thiamine phosphate synthase [Nannocystaceae bacterium]|nr:thiamine phosphate synthase [Nannocystaceae bacterium]
MTPLFAITPPSGAVDPDCIDRWHEAGARGRIALWLREPGAQPWQLIGARLRAIIARARVHGVPILLGIDASAIDEAARLVIDERFAGVVLRGDPDRAALLRARDRLRSAAWLGRSVHDPDAADHDLCDFSVLGPIFAPHTGKPFASTPLGLDALGRAPADAFVVALGGIDGTRASACLAAGARGLAGIRSFFGPAQAVAQDVAAFCTALQTATHAQATPDGRARGRGPTT